jgi:hypothetical protein
VTGDLLRDNKGWTYDAIFRRANNGGRQSHGQEKKDGSKAEAGRDA